MTYFEPYSVISRTGIKLEEKTYSFVQCADCGKVILIDFPFTGVIMCYDCMVQSFYPHLEGLVGKSVEPRSSNYIT